MELIILLGVWTNVCIQGYWLWWSKQLHEDAKHEALDEKLDRFLATPMPGDDSQSTGSLPEGFIPESRRF